MEKIFDIMGCEDAFKTRLVVFKFEGDALAWWKAYKQAKGGDERLKSEYHSIRQMDTETSTEFMQQIREEFRTSSGPSNAGGHPPPITIHTWLERFNKQKPHSFEKATTPVDAEN
nr:zinc finger, CCHC-type, retrotransposon Gag domain protein [Tanacetum cinerariifolium]